MNKKQERINKMLALFNEKEYYSCKQLAECLDISEMTVRRDIATLQELNIITRGIKAGTFSLVVNNTNPREDYELSTEETKCAAEKERIGRFAATLVSDGDTVIIDTGTTTVRMIRWIPDELELTALCYNAGIFKELEKKSRCDILLAGGQLNRATSSFNSDESVATISRFRASKYFMAASGVHEKLGLTCGYRSELANKMTAIQSSLTKILLVDSSKFGTVRAAYFGELDEVDIIVTDTGLSDYWKNFIEGKGIRLYTV